MAINLAEKYERKIAEAFKLSSVVDGSVSNEYSWDGVNAINVYTPITQPLNDYKTTGQNRYGDPEEMPDTLQNMPIRRDRSFSITIDKGNNTSQMMTKQAGKMLRLEIDEQVTPEMDQYALGQYINNAGKVAALSSAPTKNTIAEAVATGMTHLSNMKVPNGDRVIWMGWTMFGFLRLSPEFIQNDKLGAKVLTKGTLGTFMGAEVKPVPDAYLTVGGKKCYFLIAHKRCLVQPKKIKDYFVHQNPPGINGALLEGRFKFDAYVLGTKADGVYAAVENGAQLAVPSATWSKPNFSVTATGASSFKYTLDGTDPRYSKSAKESAGASGTIDTTGMSGTVTLKVVSYGTDKFTSDVLSKEQNTAS